MNPATQPQPTLAQRTALQAQQTAQFALDIIQRAQVLEQARKTYQAARQ